MTWLEKLFIQSPEFITHRLLLRRMTLDDCSDYFDFASDPEVTIHTIWDSHRTLDDSKLYLQSVMDKYSAKQAYHWGIVDRSSQKLIGRTGFVHLDSPHYRTEIGFALSRNYWNKGVITEATRELIRYGFEELDLNRMEGRCNFDNLGSARVMEKLGMSCEGILRGQLKIRGRFVDQKMYSIIRSDFNGSDEKPQLEK